MSAANSCDCPCPAPVSTQVPGSPGTPGTDGADGANGVPASTVIAVADLTMPAVAGPVTDPTSVGISSGFGVGQVLFISRLNGTVKGHFEVLTIPNSTTMTLEWLNYPGDSVGGSVLTVGSTVSPSGVLFTIGALPNAITDTATVATASDTIAAGAGKFTHSIFFRAAAITGNVLLYTYTPAFAFKIIRVSASVVDAITTGAKAATLTTAINGTPTTGGVVTLAGAYVLGAEQASSAAITAANIGTAGQAITVTASAVTAFIEGGFILEMEMANMDTANAIKSLSTHVNDLITAL